MFVHVSLTALLLVSAATVSISTPEKAATRLSLSKTLTRLDSPRYLAFSPSGELFVGERDGLVLRDATTLKYVKRYDSDLAVKDSSGIAFGTDGAVFVGQQGSFGLLKMYDGTLSKIAGGRDEPEAAQIDSALGVHVYDGKVFVNDISRYRIAVYDEKSLKRLFFIDASKLVSMPTCTMKASKSGQYQGPSCFNPTGITSGDGRVYVTDPDNKCVYMFSPEGKHLGTIGGQTQPGLLTEPRDIEYTAEGELFILEREHLLLITPDGKMLDSFKIPKGALNPMSAALNGRGKIYVTDCGYEKRGDGTIWVIDIQKSNNSPPTAFGIPPHTMPMLHLALAVLSLTVLCWYVSKSIELRPSKIRHSQRFSA